jgi:hypothetical protein
MNGEPGVLTVADEYALGAVVTRFQEIYQAVLSADMSTDFFLGIAFLVVSVWFIRALFVSRSEKRLGWRDSLYGADQPFTSIASRARRLRRERDEQTARHAAAHGVAPPAE